MFTIILQMITQGAFDVATCLLLAETVPADRQTDRELRNVAGHCPVSQRKLSNSLQLNMDNGFSQFHSVFSSIRSGTGPLVAKFFTTPDQQR